MIARLFALKLFAAIILTGCTLGANPRDLPNDCGITAAEAYSRLYDSGCWTRVIAIKALLITAHDITKVSHILVCYQYIDGSNILIYDGNGTAELPTTSHEIKDISLALSRSSAGRLLVLEAHFLSQ